MTKKEYLEIRIEIINEFIQEINAEMSTIKRDQDNMRADFGAQTTLKNEYNGALQVLTKLKRSMIFKKANNE